MKQNTTISMFNSSTFQRQYQQPQTQQQIQQKLRIMFTKSDKIIHQLSSYHRHQCQLQNKKYAQMKSNIENRVEKTRRNFEIQRVVDVWIWDRKGDRCGVKKVMVQSCMQTQKQQAIKVKLRTYSSQLMQNKQCRTYCSDHHSSQTQLLPNINNPQNSQQSDRNMLNLEIPVKQITLNSQIFHRTQENSPKITKSRSKSRGISITSQSPSRKINNNKNKSKNNNNLSYEIKSKHKIITLNKKTFKNIRQSILK